MARGARGMAYEVIDTYPTSGVIGWVCVDSDDWVSACGRGSSCIHRWHPVFIAITGSHGSMLNCICFCKQQLKANEEIL